jgi:hypothetical protein
MRRAAIGIRAHSGWGALVALTSELEVLERKRIDIIDRGVTGAGQPYHFVQAKKLPDAEKYLADCAASSERLAFVALA